jgi:hypothetical protein
MENVYHLNIKELNKSYYGNVKKDINGKLFQKVFLEEILGVRNVLKRKLKIKNMSTVTSISKWIISLEQLTQKFPLVQANNDQFFPEWTENLPELTNTFP